MNQINELPGNTDAGLFFDYAVWTPNSQITLTNVPWNNDYRDVVSFSGTTQLNAYIDGMADRNIRLNNSRYAPIHEPIVLNYPFNVINKYNYVRVYNPAQPVPGGDVAKTFYYFITDVRYSAPNTTVITVQLDVWQTFIRDVTLGRCYVERGHLGIANEDQFRNYGRDYLTVPEGIDTGAEYMPVMYRADDQIILPATARYSILVASTVKLEAPPGTVQSPNLTSAEGGRFQGLPSGASYYLFSTPAEFEAFMRQYSRYPWVTQNIISITVIPPITRYYSTAELGAKLAIGAYKAPANAALKANVVKEFDWRDADDILSYIPTRFRNLKKLWTFPYMAIELTTMTGQTVILKPELWNSPHAVLREEVALLPPNQRMSWYPVGYNYRGAVNISGGEQGDGVMYAANIGNFPALAIVNDGAISVLAANANSLAFGYQSADWSQQRALRANQVGYDQATAGINAAGQQAQIGMNADSASTAISNQLAQDSALLNAVGGAASSSAMGLVGGPVGGVVGLAGGVGSGVMSMMNTGNQINAANQQLANRLSAGQAAQGVNTQQGNYIRDTNKGLADWAANGDYENTIAGLNAKTRDINLTPPSMAGQVGGETLGMLNFRFGYRLRFMLPDQASLNTIGEYWLRYGYAVHRFSFIPDNFMVMSKFTYWKMKETYIRAAGMPESFKQAIRGIFEKGVTVWRDPDEIGLVDPAENTPLPGIVIDGYNPPPWTPDPPTPPTPAKKRNKNMLVFSAQNNEGTGVFALAGTSPGTDANWLETTSTTLAQQFMEACQVENTVGISWADFQTYRNQYLSPVATAEVPIAEG